MSVRVLATGILALASLSAPVRAAAPAVPPDPPRPPDPHVELARRRGDASREALRRCRRTLDAYRRRLDPVTGLLPRTGRDPRWVVRDSAADLFPFLVMAAWFTDRDAYETEMHAILRSEIRRASRVGRLADDVLPGGRGFAHDRVDIDRIIFGSSEYAKDGLLPLTELLGPSAWSRRLEGIVDDILAHAPYETRFGRLPSLSAEVNGELLQVLARLSFLTREARYVDAGLRLCRFYLEEVVPRSGGLPAHTWDLAARRPAADVFRLVDHGNEILGGLGEHLLFLKAAGHPSLETLRPAFIELVDAVLGCGLNSDGVWYSSVELGSRKVVDQRHAHCWGYPFHAVYDAWLLSGEERFLAATRRGLRAVIEKPTYLDDPSGSGRGYGSNAYSDAIESAIVFLNRLPDEQGFRVLDECVSRFLARQRPDGIIEDWYGDGNYVRTALMYALLATQGARVEPWREDVRLGAARRGESAVVSLRVASPWSGRLCFDRPRHRVHFRLPLDYPRLNEFPEWFTVESDRLYDVTGASGRSVRSGEELARGIRLDVVPDVPLELRIAPRDGPPYGGS